LNNFVDIYRMIITITHGIGSIKEFDIDAKTKEHLVIEYKDGDRLFVPKHDIHLVQKYVSFTKRPARFTQTGKQGMAGYPSISGKEAKALGR